MEVATANGAKPPWLISNDGRTKMNLGSKSRSLENYPRDIVDRVTEEYPADAIGQVHLWLEDLGSDRLARCAIFLAQGSLKKLEEAVSLGRADYRDLIVAAGAGQGVRSQVLTNSVGKRLTA